MEQTEECAFCEIIAREEPAREVLRTDQVVAFFPTEPATLGHTLVVPRHHLPDIWALDQRTAHALMDATLQVAHAVRRAVDPQGLNVIQSNGEVATQTVFHLHIHVVPRHRDDLMGPIWPEKTHWSEADKDTVHARVREALHPPLEGGRHD